MVSVAKQTGSGASVWPAGTNASTTSDEFLSVYAHTLNILGWFENVPSSDIPPAWMWHLDWELEKHWELVNANRAHNNGDSSHGGYNKESENLLFDDWEKELRSPN